MKRDASKRDKEERKRHQAEDDDEELARQLMYDEQEVHRDILCCRSSCVLTTSPFILLKGGRTNFSA